ncbi:hypothetical protein HYN48_10875 [Flavobacterium magnum]|uniref:SdiA-regulated family protein n=1 Tax=Flavobacterium magnum TaxID=2162713 RepID=A0A2S0RHE7_9FLAO|nr:hypothetical protein [Flavobacterium magnum]AWA30551.1 hypothetical protein HYN48_10875 [Flavobacterium magnum]
MDLRKTAFFIFAPCFLSCSSQPTPLKTVFDLPGQIKEASALAYLPNTNVFWTLEDSGNDAVLFALDTNGALRHKVNINKPNVDWEALTSDDRGNLYIGDFGNNDNDRENLMIYKINAEDLGKAGANVSVQVNFYYPEQQEFPPKKSKRIFDAEAFFLHDNYFYVFTKNRSSNSDGTTQLYKIPNVAGNHAAKLMGSFTTCEAFRKCAVTDAAISGDGKKMALLSNAKVWLFEDFSGDAFLKGKVTEIDLHDNSQKEGICFKGSEIFICDEKDKHSGGNMYQLTIDNQ